MCHALRKKKRKAGIITGLIISSVATDKDAGICDCIISATSLATPISTVPSNKIGVHEAVSPNMYNNTSNIMLSACYRIRA
jgi:hypothetical protein